MGHLKTNPPKKQMVLLTNSVVLINHHLTVHPF